MKKITAIAAFASVALVLLALPHQPASSHEPHFAAHLQADSTIDWKKMDRAERKDYMRNVVQPKMKALFAAFDSNKYADMKCAKCHGEGARTGEFKMPNPQLPKLPKSAIGFAALEKKKPAMMKFMSDTVKPEMAKLLGMKPFDPKTGSGFSCGNCHTTAKK